MRALIVIHFFVLTFIGISQESDTLKHLRLTPAQMQEDFNLYRRLIQETHPGLYRYTSKEIMQTKMDSIYSTLTIEQPFYGFYSTITSLAADIKCAHSYVIPGKDINSFLSSIKCVPFFLYPIDGKPHVLFNGTTNENIRPGFELIEINGRSMENISKAIRRHMWSDGYIELGKNQALTGSAFWLFYYTLIDQSDSLKMIFKDLDGKKVTLSTSALKRSVVERNYGKNPVNSKVLKMYSQKVKKSWVLKFSDEIDGVAFLRFNAFGGKGMDSEEEAQAGMRKFMEASVKKLKKKKTEHLVIDLRDNPGGWDIHGIELLSFLMKPDQSFSYFGDGFTATNESEFLKYSDLSEEYIKQVKEELIPQSDGTFLLDEKGTIAMQIVNARPDAFQGKIYFLINERTGSAAAEFASVVKSNRIGTFVGKETNGAYEGGNGSSFIKMELPNSGIQVRTPLVAGYTATTPVSPKGRGTLPDYEVGFTRDDLLVRNDRQMEFVKDLIRKDQMKSK